MSTQEALPLKDFLVLYALAIKGPLGPKRLNRGLRKLKGVRVGPRRIRKALRALEALEYVRIEPAENGESEYHATPSGLSYARDHAMAVQVATFEPDL